MTNIKILSKENFITITTNLQQASQTLVKRSDQCIAMLNCSHLYFNDIVKEQNKVQDCLNKAKKFADFAMTNAQNLVLFVQILNKYLFFIEKGADFVNPEILSDIIEIVKNHIQTITTESTNTSFLPEIERYFNITIDIIKSRKANSNNNIFQEIVV
jgi:vacuolar protein sorting-associated protein 35